MFCIDIFRNFVLETKQKMKKINTYKFRCDHCGGSGWLDTEQEVIRIKRDAVTITDDEEEVRCEYCGYILDNNDLEMIDTRYYNTSEDIW